MELTLLCPSPCVVAMDTSTHTWAPLAFSGCPASPTPDHTCWLQPCSYQAQALESSRRWEGADPGTSPHRDPHPVRRHLLGCWGSCMRLLIPLCMGPGATDWASIWGSSSDLDLRSELRTTGIPSDLGVGSRPRKSDLWGCGFHAHLCQRQRMIQLQAAILCHTWAGSQVSVRDTDNQGRELRGFPRPCQDTFSPYSYSWVGARETG